MPEFPLLTLARIRNSYKVQRATAALKGWGWLAVAPARRLILSDVLRRREGELHIHFGCGPIDDPRFVNVDARAMRHVHVVSRSPMLQMFASGSADGLYACHVFEHIPYGRQREVLRRWLQLLKPGGRLRLSVPDFDKLLASYAAHGNDVKSIQPALMGGQEYAGNFHYAVFTARHLTELLLGAGFEDICSWHPSEERDWPRDWSWADDVSLNLTAVRPVEPRQ